MKVSVSYGERRLVVDLPDTPGAPASIDGRPIVADLVQVRPGLYSLIVDGRSYEVALEPASPPQGAAGPQDVTAYVAGTLLALQLEDERRRALLALQADRRDDEGPAARTTLAAPMPGRVVAVPVELGEAVERGQPLVVLEAMKMESALNAPHPGIVVELLVTPGQTVQQRQPLLRLDHTA